MKIERARSLTDLVRDHVRASIAGGRLRLAAAYHGIVFKVQALRTRLAHEMDQVRRANREHHEVVRLLATHVLGTSESYLKAISDGARPGAKPVSCAAAVR